MLLYDTCPLQAVVNEDAEGNVIKLQAEIRRLREALSQHSGGGGGQLLGGLTAPGETSCSDVVTCGVVTRH